MLVILGLLVGGVLTGQSLIRAAELRNVTTTIQTYTAAIGTFRDKYFALPGDMTNATSFWTAAATCPGDNTTPATGTETCNGDGDGAIDHIVGGDYKETYRAWQHLANAGLIEGRYTGVWGSATALSAVPGTNVPKGRVGNSGIVLQRGVDAGNSTWFPASYGNVFEYGASVGGWVSSAILKPEEAWNIDTKLDDGKPGMGGVLAFKNAAAGCSTTDTASTAEYSISSSAVLCHVIFKSGF